MRSEIDHSKVLIIAVHYKSEDEVLALLDSLQALRESWRVDTIIVDNASGEEHLLRLRRFVAESPNGEVLESSTNRGYFGAAKFALDWYLAHGRSLPDWVIVCNQDVLIENKDFLLRLFEQDPTTLGVVAPRLRALPANIDDNPFMRRRPGWLRLAVLRLSCSSYRIAAMWHWLWCQERNLKGRLRFRRSHPLVNQNGKREWIYAAHGAFLIFSRRYFEAGGYLDEKLFLYGEEIAVAEICRSLSLPIIYERSLRVAHMESSSTGRALSRFSYECSKQALLYMHSRYFAGSKTARERHAL